MQDKTPPIDSSQKKPISALKDEESSKNSQTAPAPPEIKPLITAYRLAAGVTEKYVATLDGKFEDRGQIVASAGEIEKKGLYKIVVHSSAGVPLVVLDILPGRNNSEGSFKWKPAGSEVRIEIDGKIRCFLTRDGFLPFNIRIIIRRGESPKFEKFSIAGGDIPNLVNFEQALTNAKNINYIIAQGKTPIAFSQTLGLGLQPASTITETKFSFVENRSATTTQPRFLLALRASYSFFNSDQIKLFSSTDPRKLDITGTLNRIIVQHQSRRTGFDPRDISADINKPLGLWIVQIRNIKAENVFDFWSEYVRRYYESLKTVQDGLPVSFLPILTGAVGTENQTQWAVSYFSTDASPTPEQNRPDPNNNDFLYDYSDQKDSLQPEAGKIKFSALTLQPLKTHQLGADFEQLKKHNETAFVGRLSIAAPTDESTFEFYNRFEPESSDRGITLPVGETINHDVRNNNLTLVRMGALDLKFAADPANSTEPKNSKFRLLPYGDLVETHIGATFNIANIEAGGQDKIPGEEFVPEGSSASTLEQCEANRNDQALLTGIYGRDADAVENLAGIENVNEDNLEAHFRRKTPLVIGLNSSAQNPASLQPVPSNYFLTVEENSQKGSSHTIRLVLQTNPRAISLNKFTEAVVLDSEPFLVAKVKFKPFVSKTGSSIIGNWTNAGLEGINWQLLSAAEPFDLILPPQGIGEEMEKGKNNIEENKPVDFRFTPPAEITLDGSENPQNFTEPPWNLRRILGFPGQRNAGAGIERLQFELLYGLSCDSNFPFLRLAEVGALIGAIQGRLPKDAKSDDVKNTPNADIRRYYKLARLEWAALYRRYLSRISILEPWDSHQPEHLLLNKNMVCRIRSDAELAKPFEDAMPTPTPTPAPSPTPIPSPTPPPLEGGVTWGFESRNVYNAVMRDPKSDAAEVGDLYFSGFGGWGHLKAPFDDKKSTIFADVAMGRTYSYKLERIGRIGVWWNLAKHVIVYERTVVPSRQMNGLQNDLRGRAVLRKTQEYIEILEETRRYPDGQNPDSDTLKRQRGFVAACSFPKAARYNVLSSWGTDIGDLGWKIPIWKPSATPPDVYPKPQVHLELLSNVAGESVPVPVLIAEPENLYFYTETRAGSKSDPHEWNPVKDVDFVDLPAPQPLADFEGGKNTQTTPDDPPVHPGFSPCTFALEPAAVPTDMVAARAGKPLAAVLETVTMMRGRAKDKVESGDALYNKLINLRGEATSVFQEFLREIPVNKTTAQELLPQIVNTIRDKALNSISNSNGKLNKILQDLRAVEQSFESQKEDAFTKVKDYEAAVFGRLRKRLLESTDKAKAVVPLVRERYDELLRVGAGDFDRLKHLEIARQNVRLLQDGILLLNAAPGLLQKTFQQYAEVYLNLIDRAEQTARHLNAGTEQFLKGAALQEFQNGLREIVGFKDGLESRLKNNALRPAELWLPDPYPKLKELYFQPLDEQYAAFRDKITEALAEERQFARNKAQEIIRFFAETWKANEAYQRLTEFGFSVSEVEEDFAFLSRSEFDAETNAWRGWIGEQLSRLETVQNFSEFRAVIENLRARVAENSDASDNLFQRLALVESKVTEQNAVEILLNLAFNGSRNQINDLRRLIEDGQVGIVKEIERIGENLRNNVREKIEAIRKNLLEKAEDFVEKSVRGLLPDDRLVYAATDSAARLVRAFGRPPEVPNLGFDRSKLAYFYSEVEQAVGLTPVLSRVKQASAIADELQSLGVALPSKGLLDKIIPPDLSQFKLSEILPNIAGLDLSNLFSGLEMPTGTENVKISHGVDPQSRRAWVESKVNIEINEPATIFNIGPVILRLTSALFTATMRFEAAQNEPPKKVVVGSIKGTWELIISDIPLVKFNKTELRFDDSGKFRFDISPLNVELPDILSFVSDFLKSFSSPDSGFSLGLTPRGVQALLNLPIPDIQAGAFGISNLMLGMAFGLDFAGDFKIYLSFSLARKEAPFALTIFILGGGGYIETVTSYTPSTQKIECTVEVGITACASLAIALGPIKGGVYVYFGVFANLALSNQSGGENSGLTIGIMLLIRGEVNVLGIASACISLLLEARYRNGEIIGRGKLSIKIKICWCFTLKVEKQVEYKLGSGGGSAQNREPDLPQNANAGLVRFEKASFTRGGGEDFREANLTRANFPATPTVINYATYAEHYINMLN